MFNDSHWTETDPLRQICRLEGWIPECHYPIALELGAGRAIPTVRRFGESYAPHLITALHSMAHRSIHVICVYTVNWANVQDLTHARDVLRTLGFTEELGSKRDGDTRNGRIGPDEWDLRV